MPAFRWVHFGYAIEKGLNVFMEKPVAVDGPSSRKMFALAEKVEAEESQGGGRADVASQPAASGARQAHPRRRDRRAHSVARLPDARCRRVVPIGAEAGRHQRTRLPDPAIPQLPMGERRVRQRLLHPHHRQLLLDEERLAGKGRGRSAAAIIAQSPEGVPYIDQNFDVYSIEYTFADGTKFIFDGRCMAGCDELYYNFVHGSKGMAIISKTGDCGPPSSIYRASSRNSRKATRRDR